MALLLKVMKLGQNLKAYLFDIYESVTTILVGMWITFKTAFFERKITIQYPSHDVGEGRAKDAILFGDSPLNPPFEPLLGASQQQYRGPLSPRVAERYRGLLGYDEPKCISCLLCAQACPIDVIRVKGVKVPGRKTKAPVTFRIDYSKCMFCGLCVEVCPTDAIYFTRRFEGATFTYGVLIKEFISAELRNRRLDDAKKMEEKTAKDQAEV